jgi:hypothetical protein
LDTFTVQSTAGGINFVDTFADGIAPPSGPSPAGTSTYFVTGTFSAGDETGGKLTLNTEAGAITANATGAARQTIGASRATNIDPTSTNTNGLTEGRDILVSGLFDAVTPQGPLLNSYSIAFWDIAGSSSTGFFLDRALQVNVQYLGALGGAVVSLSLQDFTANTVTVLAFVPFDPTGADQILLSLSAPAGSSFFQAGYSLLNGGQSIGSYTLGGPQEMFLRTGHGRGSFLAFTQVPEPAVGALLAMGALMLGAVRRRQRR